MIHVTSEVKPLLKVLLHRPGDELLNIIPDNLSDLLFEDIPYLKIAQKEHDIFANTLKENGVEVVYLENLMAETLDQNPNIKEKFIKQFIKEADINSEKLVQLIYDYLIKNYPDNLALVNKLITGLRLSEINKEDVIDLYANYQIPEVAMLMNPIPNLYFQRDPFASIGNGLSINKMHTKTRSRETIFAEYIFNYHKEYKESVKYYNRYLPNSIEGGDIANLTEKVLLVGATERTSSKGVMQLALNCFLDPKCQIEEVYVLPIPKTRAFMHLDTVFTQVDYDKFAVHPLIIKTMKVYKITADGKGGIFEQEYASPLDEILADILKLDHVELIPCGGGDAVSAAREQWNDGPNTLCIAPGKIIAYDRNEVTNAALRARGVEVLEIPSSELSRGRGGPRCMSMPLVRKD